VFPFSVGKDRAAWPLFAGGAVVLLLLGAGGYLLGRYRLQRSIATSGDA
jgi:hypothetical protein